jgi:hypothetical protein
MKLVKNLIYMTTLFLNYSFTISLLKKNKKKNESEFLLKIDSLFTQIKSNLNHEIDDTNFSNLLDNSKLDESELLPMNSKIEKSHNNSGLLPSESINKSKVNNISTKMLPTDYRMNESNKSEILPIDSMDMIKNDKSQLLKIDSTIGEERSIDKYSCQDLSDLILNYNPIEVDENLLIKFEKENNLEHSILLPSACSIIKQINDLSIETCKDKLKNQKNKEKSCSSIKNKSKILLDSNAKKVAKILEEKKTSSDKDKDKLKFVEFEPKNEGNGKVKLEIITIDINDIKNNKNLVKYFNEIEERIKNYKNLTDKNKYSSNEANILFRIIVELKAKEKRIYGYLLTLNRTITLLGIKQGEKLDTKKKTLLTEKSKFDLILNKTNLLRRYVEEVLYTFKLLKDD